MFIDEVKIKVISWKWWDGIVSWRREKYIPKWWPWWWDGWKWWDVYLVSDPNLNTLWDFRHKKVLKAQNWESWWTNCKHWADGEDLVIKVPTWTLVKNTLWELIVDLSKDYQKFLIASWWRWGYWNAHFVSSTRQAPSFRELWDIEEEVDLNLELKLVADIWIIGIPSAWKSSFIWTITNVKPKIWDYPFTTLIPNLGVFDYKWKSLVLEDVPWLIPWASNWKWLWIEFLKHIERTGALIHMLDLYRLDNIFQDYDDIRKELEHFSKDLSKKREIIVFSKCDLLDWEMKDYIVKEFFKKFPKIDKDSSFVISSATWEWIDELKDFLISSFDTFNKSDLKEEIVEEIKVYDLKEDSDPKSFKVDYLDNFTFCVRWERIEQIVRMTDFDNKEWIMRVYDVLDKFWIIKEIEKILRKSSTSGLKNDFFFEWNEDESFDPKIVIWDKEIPLNKLKYNL